eukprot:CAMPEP_0203001048 /NCGR_PEP_ID=MMETSP1401-20130829/295_1 /ASSEMBLY_ACC=CAM_ASM_000894 /TAXON_ID=38833 /ORGANISM="Micromonas pusilla, Strain CCAC1681" /LENGTH=109 /DNA_ID=CAMNT_0049742501 /DNA_START=20 /DNA_END=349 /DNA_ORIENTATION=+
MGATTSRCEEAEAEPVEEVEVEEPVAEVEEESAADIKIETAPFDPRFPQTNQAKHCYTRYNEFHKCKAQKGEDDEECEKYAKYYRSLCPTEWVTKWNEEREAGTWPGRY